MSIIALTLLSIFGLFLVKFMINEAITIIRLLGFKKKGLKKVDYVFWPLEYIKPKKRPQTNDVYRSIKDQYYQSDESQPIEVLGFNGICLFHLMSHEAISEYYKNELEFTEKLNPSPTLDFLGFFFKNGQKVQKERALFSKIFHYKNLMKMMPQISLTIKSHVRHLREKVAAAEDQTLKVDIKEELLHHLFDDLTGCILLTGADKKIDATFEGMNISFLLKSMFEIYDTHYRQFISKFPFIERLGFNKAANEFRRLQKGFDKIIKDQYRKRYNLREEELKDDSIIDIMVRLNKKAERETGKPEYTLEAICSHFGAFQFAGSDTSFQVSSSLTTFLAKPENQVYQEKLWQELKTHLKGEETVDNDKLNSLKMLDCCFKETTRMANPVAHISTRMVAKDFKLCGYQLKRGDYIRQFLLQYQPQYYKDPFKFMPERFSEEANLKIPFTKHIPFSYGKRACVGRYLGEMMVKLIVSELIMNFKCEVEEGYVMKMGMSPLYGVTNAEIIFRPRND